VDRYKEQTREARGIRPLEELAADLRFAFRNLRKSPGFTAVALLSLALGIGANTAVFSLVNAIVFRDSPVEDPETLINLYRDVPGFSAAPQAYPDLEEIEAWTRGVFQGLAGTTQTFAQVEAGDRVETVMAELVTGEYFSLQGLHAAAGRILTPADDVSPGRHFVAMLGHGYWQRVYGGDPGVVGTTIPINGLSFEIVGVIQPEYPGYFRGFQPDVFAPAVMLNQFQPGQGDRLEDRDTMLWLRARLRPGVSLQEARAAMDGLAAELRRTHPDNWEESDSFRLVAQSEVVLNPMFDRIILPAVTVSMVMVALVLLIAAANLASYLLARGIDRRKEIAVRRAMGATRPRLVRQLLTEAMVLAGLGGVLGVGLARWALNTALSLDLPYPVPVSLDTSLQAEILAFTLSVSVAAGLFFGLLPALRATRPEPAPTLRDGTGGTSPRILLRRLLVGGQVAVSLLLLVTAGLFLRSFGATAEVDPGFGDEPAGVVTLFLPASRYDPEAGRVFLRELEDRTLALPGVEAVGVTENLPLTTYRVLRGTYQADGVEPPPGQRGFQVDRTEVDAGFFEAMGIPILQGRNFRPSDEEGAEGVVIVNQALADLFWPGEEAVGRVLREAEGRDLLVVGVARTTKVRTLGEPPTPALYYPHNQVYSSYVSVVARTAGIPEEVTRDMVALLREMDRDVLIFDQTTLGRHLDVMLIPARLSALLSSLFGALALILSCIGLYGIVSYSVARRTREMGVRLCLGAPHSGVVSLLLREGIGVVAVGGAVGILLSLVAGRALSGLLFQVRPSDPVTLFLASFLFLGVTLLAIYLPALRAGRVDPVTLLRTE
jgi:predicted permease